MEILKGKSRERFEMFIRRTPFVVQRMFFERRHKKEQRNWIEAGMPSPPPRIIKENTIKKYKDLTGYDTLVETGTYRGDMVFAQLNNFKKIYSIELDEGLYQAATKRFKPHSHVEILQGDSGKILSQVVSKLSGPAVFWLDGHYSGGITAFGEEVTPVYEELKVIFSQKIDHAILIDDARLFNGSDGYPTFDDLAKFIKQHYPQQRIEVSDDCIQFVLKN
jgi:hypothetical protein